MSKLKEFLATTFFVVFVYLLICFVIWSFLTFGGVLYERLTDPDYPVDYISYTDIVTIPWEMLDKLCGGVYE